MNSTYFACAGSVAAHGRPIKAGYRDVTRGEAGSSEPRTALIDSWRHRHCGHSQSLLDLPHEPRWRHQHAYRPDTRPGKVILSNQFSISFCLSGLGKPRSTLGFEFSDWDTWISHNMPREYMCKRCGRSHMPPTGKKCTLRELDIEPEEVEAEVERSESPDMMMLIKAQLDGIEEKMSVMDGFEERMQRMEASRDGGSVIGDLALEVRNEQGAASQGNGEIATPSTIRNDVRAMQRAAERIAQFRIDDSDDDDDIHISRSKKKGKKSGSMMLAAETVEERIDWPHMHVKRMVAGRRVPVPYKELKVDEFVYGFVQMLKSPKCEWNRDTMLDILGNLMEDSMDYAWENARAFYLLVGIDVEQGVRTWEDTDQITTMRLLHSRAVFPDKKENKEQQKKPTNTKAVSPNTKYCALFQQKSCEMTRDHQQFVHACAFCARVTGTLYRHPEADCFRKSLEQAKNGQPRE